MNVIQRPTAITVIGWLYVGFGLLMALGGAFGLVMSFAMPTPHTDLSTQPDMPAPFKLMSHLFDYFWVAAGVQLLVAVLMIVAGAAFLKLKPWSRPVLEGVAWAGLLYDIGFGVFWIWGVSSMGARNPPAGQAPETAFFAGFLAFGVVLILAFAVPPIVVIRSLRGATVRQALTSAGA